MREMGLAARRGRRRPPRTTDSRHDLPVAPNLLDRHFVADRPDTVWLADISYLPTDEGWLYLAAIEDLATREIVGWSMADHLRAELCVDALVMALQRWTASRGVEGWDQNITRPRACRSLPCRPAPRPGCGSPRPSASAAGCRRSRHTRTPPPGLPHGCENGCGGRAPS